MKVNARVANVANENGSEGKSAFGLSKRDLSRASHCGLVMASRSRTDAFRAEPDELAVVPARV
jgi:hypothetical protein